MDFSHFVHSRLVWDRWKFDTQASHEKKNEKKTNSDYILVFFVFFVPLCAPHLCPPIIDASFKIYLKTSFKPDQPQPFSSICSQVIKHTNWYTTYFVPKITTPLQVGQKSIFLKRRPTDDFNDACIFFLMPLGNQNHEKTQSFVNPNMTVLEQTCVYRDTRTHLKIRRFLFPQH